MLRRGQRITIDGVKYRVQYVNYTGAFITPVKATIPRTIKNKRTGAVRTFFVKAPNMLISANSVDC